MTRREIQTVVIVSFIVALRLLGIFLILPVFSLYAMKYPGATLPRVGLAFGIYALTQSLFQIPMGWTSDRFGRKPLLLVGLLMFSAGSFLCGVAENVLQLTLARAVQGTGAVGSVAMAALGDISRPQVRTQAFTITGMAVGAAFVGGLFGGPFLAAHIGLGGLFHVLGLVAFLAALSVILLVPDIQPRKLAGAAFRLQDFLRNVEVRRLCLAASILSFTLNLFLFTYPLDWSRLGLERSELWKVYATIFLPSLLFVFPYVRYAERRQDLRSAILIGWLLMTGGYLFYTVHGPTQSTLYWTGVLFMLGYSLFQPFLPSLLTRIVPPLGRGGALGLYNLCGFLGASAGGMLAGVLISVAYLLPGVLASVLLLTWPLLGLPRQPAPVAPEQTRDQTDWLVPPS